MTFLTTLNASVTVCNSI